jgi:hypothetical protein
MIGLPDEFILVPKTNGTVDDFFEAFFKAFEGNPSLVKHADEAALRTGGGLEPLSLNAKARLKQFLGVIEGHRDRACIPHRLAKK